MWGSFLFTALA